MFHYSRTLATLAAGLLLCAAPALADDTPPASPAPSPSQTQTEDPATRPGVEIQAGVWSPTLSGTIGQGNSNVSLTGALHLPNASSPAVDVSFRTPRSTFFLGYASLSQGDSTSLNQPFFYSNHYYTFSDSITSNLNFSTIDLGWMPELTGGSGGELDFLVMVKILNLNTNVRDNTFNFNGSANYTAPVPLLGLGGRAALGKNLDIYGRFGYLSANISGINGSVFDYRAGLKYYFNNFDVSADYRGFSFNGHDNNDNQGNLTYSGPSFEVGYKF